MVTLRGHTLLCLQGFRGEGYSPSFVEQLQAIHQTLCDNPRQLVKVIVGPDDVCGACPHLAPSGCTLGGDRAEESMVQHDTVVLGKLGLHPDTDVPWSDVLDRIALSIAGSHLPDLCGSCRWLPLGYCREGIDRLPVDRSAMASPSLDTDPSSSVLSPRLSGS